MFSEWDGTPWAGSEIKALSLPDEDVSTLLNRVSGYPYSRLRPWRTASVAKALGVPAIQRAVTLISNTTGALTVQAFRNSAVMSSTPAVVARPNPYETPRDFYRDSAYNLATRGECVWWIANRDGDRVPSALVVVPLNELRVEATNDRMRPKYTWGDPKDNPITGTRYSPAHKDGSFVHITYLKEPGALRGSGPLQLGGAAVSVAVEAQEWAANFYGDGGHPSLLIKHAGILSPTGVDPETFEPAAAGDPDAVNEADLLRNQWMEKPHNVPRVIDQNIESVEYMSPNEGAAQGLKSRDFQTGEAARLYGMPGALLEYGVAGASLTYQNLADVWLNFVRGCLAPNYLEPIEQAMSDLLSRSTVARFLTSGLYRADAKTRWEIYEIMSRVLGLDRAAELAQIGEDMAPGNPETAPLPMTIPTIPVAIPAKAESAQRIATLSDVRCPNCNRLVGRVAGTAELACRHCKQLVRHEGAPPQPEPESGPRMEVHAHFPPDFVRIDAPVTVHPPDIQLSPTFAPAAQEVKLTVETGMEQHLAAVASAVESLGDTVTELEGRTGSEAGETRVALADLAEKQESLAKLVAAPRKRRVVARRDESGRITDADVIDEPAA